MRPFLPGAIFVIVAIMECYVLLANNTKKAANSSIRCQNAIKKSMKNGIIDSFMNKDNRCRFCFTRQEVADK